MGVEKWAVVLVRAASEGGLDRRARCCARGRTRAVVEGEAYRLFRDRGPGPDGLALCPARSAPPQPQLPRRVRDALVSG